MAVLQRYKKRPPSVGTSDLHPEPELSIEGNIQDIPDLPPDLPFTNESEEVDINGKSTENEPVTIDFENEDFSSEFVGKKTVESQHSGGDAHKKTIGADEVRSQIGDYEKEKSRSQTFADFQQTAEFLLGIVDMLWSNGMRFFARDTTSTPYQLPKSDMKKLVDPLAMVLAKHSAKFAIEWILILGLISAYSGSFIKVKMRREELSGKKKPPEPQQEPTQPTPEESPASNNISEMVSDLDVGKPKKKKYKYKRYKADDLE